MVTEWLVMFADGPPGWWRPLTRPGFRHVLAAGCDAERKLWVFVDPSRARMSVEAVPYGDEALATFSALHAQASHILRVKPRNDRRMMPPMFGCVAAIKALTGTRSTAVTPFGLYRALLRAGAACVGGEGEPVAPSRHGQPFLSTDATGAGPDHDEAVERSTATRRRRQSPVDPAAIGA